MVFADFRIKFWYLFCFYLVIMFFLSNLITNNVSAQAIPVGISENIEGQFRRSQILGTDSSLVSYMIRPINSGATVNIKKSFSILPILWRQQYNTSSAYGTNDGAIVPAKGYQTLLSAGVFAKYGILSIQFRPEFVFAENRDYRELHETNNGQAFQNSVSSRLNRIDLPSRFGKDVYHNLSWGQSNIKLTLDPVAISLSNENLWWGPGMFNSLLMSNNAPGFKHLSLHTSRPVKTPLGSIEMQLIGGKLEGSNVHDLEGTVFTAKPGDWRYFSGIVMTWQPKWVPNLFLGFDRSFIIYHNDMAKGIGAYLPVFGGIEKKSFNNDDDTTNDEDSRRRDQYFSLFARWLMPESKSEVYLQYGRNDFAWDLRDMLVEPEHSRAYIVGYRKLIGINRPDEYIQLGIELTQMSGSNTGKVRDQPSWYIHSQVPAGYTNKGQVLGAGAGIDNDQQSLDISWISGLKRVGLTFVHIMNDENLSRNVTGERKNWTDLAFIGNYDWTYKNFIVNSRLGFVRSNNYLYENKENNPNNNLNNMHLQLGLLYNL
ncbi:hypothetical protein EZ437_01495 [Pedobacter psychroterrae]|uniref:Capsule assembly protein Wzi n=2 Tax=Pedobacter psychroterrae TaxID=2530453 RepID=A0A4R0NR88_9SPHI|nr:hypothetical protein EZ437_01495 [Pedobacter psychroterrae]